MINVVDYNKRWVGKRNVWDLYAAHQFNVLTSLGLREYHVLLDIGCGSLRGGRLFISYLEPRNYYGIEPEKNIISGIIKDEMGEEYINKRRPFFDYNKDANLSIFNKKFDFILAHSVLIHAPKSWIKTCFKEVKRVLRPDGKFVATITFAEKDSEETNWKYSDTRHFTRKTIGELAKQSGLKLEITKIIHPTKRDTWIILTH